MREVPINCTSEICTTAVLSSGHPTNAWRGTVLLSQQMRKVPLKVEKCMRNLLIEGHSKNDKFVRYPRSPRNAWGTFRQICTFRQPKPPQSIIKVRHVVPMHRTNVSPLLEKFMRYILNELHNKMTNARGTREFGEMHEVPLGRVALPQSQSITKVR